MTENIDSDIVEVTKENAKNIKAINIETVHKICSGQVVLNLASAVKELVENSIDAAASIIEVKFREQGVEQIDVVDNGLGVEESNFEGLTAKYHTSKLRQFSDLAEVTTFGFRGEALSSLCALADLTITTRHKNSEFGTKLEFNHLGIIKNQTRCARQIGTTVMLTNLFSTLPVRKREFQKNIKKEFTKMCQILQGYCLVATGVRIICTNQSTNGAKKIIMSTNVSNSVLDNVTAIFGPKQTSSLLKMQQATVINENQDEKASTNADTSLNISQTSDDKVNFDHFKIDGWISSCSHGSGRTSRDRQFFFVNSRPCEPKNIMKIVNETYHIYNIHQSPFVFLNVIIEGSDVDINITPDKRQIWVNNENMLVQAIKNSLLNTFATTSSTFKMQNLDKSNPTLHVYFEENTDEDKEDLKQASKHFSNMLSQWRVTGRTDCSASTVIDKKNKRKLTNDIEVKTKKMKKFMESYMIGDSNEKHTNYDEQSIKTEFIPHEDNTDLSNDDANSANADISQTTPIQEITQINTNSPSAKNESDKEFTISCKTNSLPQNNLKIIHHYKAPVSKESKVPIILDIPDVIDVDASYRKQQNISKKNTVTSTSLNDIKTLIAQEENLKNAIKAQSLERLKFKALIDPSKNKAAEEELATELSSENFSKMEIIGQFNLGFIVVKLNDDLFIVDQHAADEKYNFETLQKSTVLQTQQLCIPQQLELTAVNEMILIDNIEIFEMNGFKFDINNDALPTKKVKLISKPLSKNWEFGKEDIDELIFMIQDSPNTICRPSRVRSMFASRACRKSVMVGTSVSKSDMRRLVDQMGQIEHPWNCPHGRPTMRHLINLTMLTGDTEE